jgi:hypothetical protein
MDANQFFYSLFLVDDSNRPTCFIGSAFPIVPTGGLLTCRHVVSVNIPKEHAIAVFDPSTAEYRRIPHPPVLPSDPGVDIAYLPEAAGVAKTEFFPILLPSALKIGESVYTYGFFSSGGDVERGYFAGKVVSFFRYKQTPNQASLMLPYPILEGMSGSPVLTYHNGPKLVGIATGNRTSRIVAAETIEYKDEKREFKETINRIVEFGIAYHCDAVVRFLEQIEVSDFVVSDSRVSIPGLE